MNGVIAWCSWSASLLDASSEPVIRCTGLVRRFGERRALDGIDLEVAAGETVVLTGPNGAGKTTLLRVLATVLRPDVGRRLESAGAALPLGDGRARGVDRLRRSRTARLPGLTARENLELYATLFGVAAARWALRSRGWAWPTGAMIWPGRSPRGMRLGWRSRAPRCTTPTCSCSTSPRRGWTPTARRCSISCWPRPRSHHGDRHPRARAVRRAETGAVRLAAGRVAA